MFKKNSRYKKSSVNEKDKIIKRLSILGVASRREAEKLVTDGKVKINNVVCKEPFFLVSYDDKISVNEREVVNKPINTQVYIMNKPAGYVTTNNDPQGRRTIFDLIPSKFGRLISIGRLDFNTEGLLLLTNNGELARIMEMPATALKRVYYARVFGDIDDKVKEKLFNLKNGIKIEGTEYGKMIVEICDNFKKTTTLKITIFEGKNNEIRRIMWHLGLKVVKLSRVQYGDFRLQGLPTGCVRKSNQYINMRALEYKASKNAKKYNLMKEKNKQSGNIDDKSTKELKDINSDDKENSNL